MKKNNSEIRIKKREIQSQLKSPKRKQELDEIRYNLKYGLNEENLFKLIKEKELTEIDFLFNNPFPRNIKEIRLIKASKFKKSLLSELIWNKVLFCHHWEKINHFLELEEKYYHEILGGNPQKALSYIERIENDICFSEWGIEQRFIIAEHTELQKKQELIEYIKDNKSHLFRVLNTYKITKIDKQLPNDRYEDILNKFLGKQRQSSLKEYFNFKLNYDNCHTLFNPELILYFDSNASIIDRYLTFINCCSLILTNSKNEKNNYSYVKQTLIGLREKISDKRLNKLYIITERELKNNIPENLQDELSKIHFELNKQNENIGTNEFNEESRKNITSNLTNISLLVKYLTSISTTQNTYSSITENDSFIDVIATAINAILQKKEDYNAAIMILQKVCSTFESAYWANEIRALLHNELNLFTSNSQKLLNYTLNDKIISDDFFCLIDFSKSIKIGEERKETIKDFSGPWNHYNKTKQLYLNKKYIEAIEFSKEVLNSFINRNDKTNSIVAEFLTRILVNSLTSNNQILDAARIICNKIIENNNRTQFYRNTELIDALIKCESPVINKEIYRPILIRVYGDIIQEIWFAYDDFMYLNDYKFPNQLFNESNYPESVLNSFLSDVCLIDIFDSSPNFKNIDELENERIKICNFLIKSDSNNKDAYISEITGIETKALTRKGVKQVDQSKIFVDTNSIWRDIEQIIKERFNHSKELYNLSKSEIDYYLSSTSSIFFLYMDSGEVKVEASKGTEPILNHPHFIDFKENFHYIRDRFISSNEFGLDSYLSIRIRHGTLLGEIRRIFESHQLITKINSKQNQYFKNEYWLKKLAIADENQKCIEIFNSFSEKVDRLSDHIKDNIIQINTEDKNKQGMFDFKYDDNELLEIYQNRIISIEDHIKYYEIIIEELWNRTEICLSKIREEFNTKFANDLILSLSELEENLKAQKLNNDGLEDLTKEITTCQTNIRHSFSKISNWFTRSSSSNINEFMMSLALKTSLSIINKMYPNTQINSPKERISSNSLIEGRYFVFFIDIMRNLLDNVINKSELTEPELNVEISIIESNNKLEITVSNNLSSGVNIETLNTRINATKNLLNQNDISKNIKREGGTGYLKIRNILEKVLKRKRFRILIDKINGTRIFKSKIVFELDGLIKNNENTTN